MRWNGAALVGAQMVALVASSAAAQGGTDIHVLALEERDGRVVVSGPPEGVTDRVGYDNQPAFTADGAAVLYTSIRDGQADTYRFDLETGTNGRLTRTAESEYSPTPVPGSPRFSAVRVEADSTQRLWSFAADGTDARLLLAGVAPVGYHAWVDHDRVALFVLGDPATLRLADVRTGAARVMARRIGRSLQPVPGRAAATFTHEEGGAWWIRELDAESGEVRPV
ncbi:MAG TPA: hypothetical protein VMM83_06175, partial [Longimicrobiales bacterium]|nr:hypothetical protein [Longimicrobiales bacterium]